MFGAFRLRVRERSWFLFVDVDFFLVDLFQSSAEVVHLLQDMLHLLPEIVLFGACSTDLRLEDCTMRSTVSAVLFTRGPSIDIKIPRTSSPSHSTQPDRSH